MPVPDPPQVGQCLLAAVRRSVDRRWTFDQVTVSAAGVGPAANTNFGEVVAVASRHARLPVNGVQPDEPPGAAGLPADGSPLCRLERRGRRPDVRRERRHRPGAEHAEDTGVGPARKLGPWRPVSTTSIALYGPNLWQYMSGQHWLACVLLPRDAPYAGSVRGGPSGSASSAFAACWNRGGVRAGAGRLHPAAQRRDVRRGQVWTTTDRAALDGSCVDLVRSATGMSDPGRGGAITVEVQVGGSNGATSQSDSAGQASCTISVVGDRRLTASLTGIGDGPLPWA